MIRQKGAPSLDAWLIDQLDRAEDVFEEQEPVVHAFLEEQGRFERLRRETEALAQASSSEEARPACYGLLVGVKDIFHVDGFVTHAGSQLPPEVLQGSQAESVSNLRDAGALILGKTVTTEFAYFAPGPTRNPRNPEHTPGGSSSGSAAAVAAGMCSLALGTQTIGSIIRPASFCGVVGLKPTYDRVFRQGVIPLSPSLDHVGCITPDVATLRRVAPTLYTDWKESVAAPTKPVLAIPEGAYLESASPQMLSHFREICQILVAAGYELRPVPLMADFSAIRARHDMIMSAEAARVHAIWFQAYEPLYAVKTADLIRRGQQVSDAQLSHALDERAAWRDELISFMEREKIDLWISPSAPGPAPKGLESTGDPVMNLPWTQAGFPTINLPAGSDDHGLPLGVQVTAGWNADEALLQWAQGMETVVGRL